MIAQFPQLEEHRDWAFSDAKREALRAEALDGHSGDLWVFGYGSLMWDPALRFTTVRRAHLRDHARRMILVDWRGARGTADAPGLMAALDHGPGCHGLVFRIAEADVDRETEILFRREMIAPGYHARFVTVDIDEAPARALAFVADHTVDDIKPELSRAEQIRYIAHGAGFLGTSRDYLLNIVEHFETLGIHDPECSELLGAVDAYLETQDRAASGAETLR
ncbi:gamma-glutamylcyclotransferase [Cognatishimia sp. F0-27]|uniref:gamma-glutamylcyclotransferase n=1 Tax=Cognatishimia sp. F0-27 TaxID=2816855 RepID=UPI001D0C1FC2|nr:gamma-glutamylcyclotransferase [Cognatishimia sp. F0-27]MCC1491483.1 gamma-glutamylcyclotransferase [Cognatishimia sp. F0-27]